MARQPKSGEARKTGRPSGFTADKANAICERIARGDSLRSICSEEGSPDQTTVFRWLDQNESFREQYAHARERQADVYADRVVDDALTATDASLGRLKMDALKWAASKLAPKKYGDKLAHVGGEDGDAPIKTTLTVSFVG